MKKHSKFFAALAVILMLACMMTACAPAATSSGKTESKASEIPASSKADEKPVTLKYVNYGAKPDSGNCDGIWKAVNDILSKDLNCTMEVEYLGSGDKSQMALKYAGNEEFDFAYTAHWFGFADNAQNNAFRALTMDELKQYAPYMVENLPDIAWKQASVGGQIYMLPNIIFEYNNGVFLVRGDLREKYGLDALKTMDDLEKYLEVVAKNEPGMEALGNNYVEAMWLVCPNEWRGDIGNDGWAYDVADAENPAAFCKMFTDAYLTYAKKMREFYEKGIFTSNIINDTTAAIDKFKNGIAAAVAHNALTMNQTALALKTTNPDWKVELFNPYMGKKLCLGNFTGNGFAVTRTSKYATKVIEVVNHIYDSVELQKLLNYGVEGVDYELQDGMLTVKSDVPADKKMNIGCHWNMSNDLLKNTFAKKEKYDGYAEIMADFEKNTVSHPLQAFTFNKSAVETEVANITAVSKEYGAIRFGLMEDVEGTVAAYRAALKDAGYEKVQAEYDRQIKEFMAAYSK